MGAVVEPGNIRIVTELLSQDLDSLLRSSKGRSLPLFVRMKMAKGAATGMCWLHGNNTVHRDLKPANLLVDSQYQVKVGDFGFSQLLRGSSLRVHCFIIIRSVVD